MQTRKLGDDEQKVKFIESTPSSIPKLTDLIFSVKVLFITHFYLICSMVFPFLKGQQQFIVNSYI